MVTREYSLVDRFILRLDRRIGGVFKPHPPARNPYPAANVREAGLDEAERRHSACLMRVNHAGEVSAQALYQGQSLFSRDAAIRQRLQQSASEEVDHLDWCRQRLEELGDRTSFLNPLWGSGSFSIGVLAGLAGDKWSLGFIAETERQVVRHLQRHLQRLPAADTRSRAILEQMVEDEARHGESAMESGGVELPYPVRVLMTACSKVMTGTAYYL
ncbi:MAG TPA: 2-polyprenyl-3-methyl-6-methoxy-1,4-benzoquinone monooxygenase [Gammaproteobacteria bacterium]|nr:2-polyprenyl-3-methyl-6-methoxy-1,4-benzoquinone monooxygenase [Gammaproteobacteria bacterium]